VVDLPIGIQHFFVKVNTFFEYVYIRGCELAGWNPFLKEKIEFSKGSTARFRNAEIGIDDTQEAEPGLNAIEKLGQLFEGTENTPRRIQ
jgi:hypothetical protein